MCESCAGNPLQLCTVRQKTEVCTYVQCTVVRLSVDILLAHALLEAVFQKYNALRYEPYTVVYKVWVDLYSNACMYTVLKQE